MLALEASTLQMEWFISIPLTFASLSHVAGSDITEVRRYNLPPVRGSKYFEQTTLYTTTSFTES